MKRIIVLAALLTLALVRPALAEPLSIFVSIAPQKYFVEKIAGDLAEVRIMVPPGASPHLFEPKPRQMVELSRAKLYFSIGIDFEKAWLGRFQKTAPRPHHRGHGRGRGPFGHGARSPSS